MKSFSNESLDETRFNQITCHLNDCKSWWRQSEDDTVVIFWFLEMILFLLKNKMLSYFSSGRRHTSSSKESDFSTLALCFKVHRKFRFETVLGKKVSRQIQLCADSTLQKNSTLANLAHFFQFKLKQLLSQRQTFLSLKFTWQGPHMTSTEKNSSNSLSYTNSYSNWEFVSGKREDVSVQPSRSPNVSSWETGVI